MGRRAKNKQGEPEPLTPAVPKQTGKRKAVDDAETSTPKKAKAATSQKDVKGKQKAVSSKSGDKTKSKSKRAAVEDDDSEGGGAAPANGEEDDLTTHKKYSFVPRF